MPLRSGRCGEPEELGPLAVYLASDAAALRDGRGVRHRRRLHALVDQPAIGPLTPVIPAGAFGALPRLDRTRFTARTQIQNRRIASNRIATTCSVRP